MKSSHPSLIRRAFPAGARFLAATALLLSLRPAAGLGQLPDPGVVISPATTALVVVDPQNDFLSPAGVTWGLVGASVTANRTVENIDALLRSAKQRGYAVFVSPHYYYPTDSLWQHGGAVETMMHAIHMFSRVGPLNLAGLVGSGADWLSRYKPYLEDGKTVVASPHKVYGPETNDLVLQLRKRGLSRVILAGMSANLCVEAHLRELLESDSELNLHAVSPSLGGSSVLGAAPAEAGGWWFSTVDGELIKTDAHGVPLLRSTAPFGASALWPDAASRGVLATRSPERFSFVPESPGSPLVGRLDAQARPGEGRGTILIPQHSLLATLANTGYAAAIGDTVFFAPLSRPEVVALSPAGDTIWVSRADAVPPTPEPRIRLVDGQVRIDYQPLNLGLTVGPDSRLYVLRATDTSVSRVRVDVLDRRTGEVLWRVPLRGPRVTLAANRLGRVYALDADRLLGAIPPVAREPLPGFELLRMGGGRGSLQAVSGRVVLINLRASWCVPCRTEMPALDSLQRALRGEGFAFLALSEDRDRDDAERFVTEGGFDFPVLFGDGRLKARFHYPGLPMTLLVDREGRIVRRWFGGLQPPDYQLIRTLVRSELAIRPGPETGGVPLAPHQHHPGS